MDDVLESLAASNYWRQEDARRALDGWRASGAPLDEFAEAHGLGAARLRRWRDRLALDEPALPPFVSVEVAPMSAGTAIEVVVGPRVIRVAPGFCPTTLAAVVRALEATAC